MKFRNAKYNAAGTIDCEVEHPNFGWVPFTASPSDILAHGRDIYELAKGVAAPYPMDDVSLSERLAKKRQSTSLSKSEFVLACVGAGILTDAEALDVGRGGWPNAMNDFLAYLTPQQALTVQLEWASVKDIRRTNVFVMTLGSWLGISDTDLDNLFGIGAA